eukprot:6768355-Lingulodinium_polyedra.AAC.1
MPIPCALQFADRSTGAATKSIVDEQAFLALYSPLTDLFSMEVDCRTIDSAASNLCCEAERSRQNPAAWSLVLPCQVHTLSNIQGRSYCAVSRLMSGLISLGLAMRPAGSTTAFRQAVAYVLSLAGRLPRVLAIRRFGDSAYRDSAIRRFGRDSAFRAFRSAAELDGVLAIRRFGDSAIRRIGLLRSVSADHL